MGSALCASSETAFAGDRFAIVNNQLLGNGDVFHVELPPSLTGQGLTADPSQQDIFAVGLLYANLPGVPPSLGAVRYGRGGNRGEARIVAGPVDLGIMLPMGTQISTYNLRAGFARITTGPILSVVTGTDAKIYLYNARTLATYIPTGLTVNYIDISMSTLSPKPTNLTAVFGSGNRVYAADATQPIVVQHDLQSGVSSLCRFDSPVLAFVEGAGGMIQAQTSRGTAQFMGDCSSGTLTSTAPAPMVRPATELDLTTRTWSITDRIAEPTMSQSPNMNRTRRGTLVNIIGTTPTTVTISPGTCTARTTFLAGDLMATPVAATMLNLSVAAPTKALYAEQVFPGEDCTAILSSGTGEALWRIRGSAENLGATAFLLDRSWSMERNYRGVGDAPAAEQRITALRHSLISLLGTLTFPLYVPPPSMPLPNPAPNTGPWVYLPFTDDAPSAWSTPMTGFTSGYNMANPDHPNGLRVKGFATATSDKFDPGGPTDLTQAMRAALTRLVVADTLPVDSTGTQRRLWILSDNHSGRKSYIENQKVLSTIQQAKASMRYFGIGGHGLDPLLQQFVAQSTGFGGDRQYGPPRGHAIEVHSPSALHEAVVAATVRDVLRGRPLGTIGRGAINNSAPITANFKLARDAANRDDPWVLFVGAWDQADAPLQLVITNNSNPAYTRCMRSSTSIVCASAGFNGDWAATLSVKSGQNASTFGMVRAFTASTGPAGDVALHTSFARAMYKSGQKLRVQAYLTERGLPLRLATVTAKVYGPNASLGTVTSQSKIAQADVANLISSNGDVSPGQAKVELLDPTALPAQKPVALNLTLYDDGVNGGDNETQDGIYQGEFQAFIPGVYTVEIKADYSGLFPNNTRALAKSRVIA